MSTQNAVIGTDGKYPVIDDEPLWRMWSIDQLWQGTVGQGRYVPKVRDWVIDPSIGETWIVDHIDPVSLIPTLRPIEFFKTEGGLKAVDVIMGVGPGTPSEIYRVYLNTSVYPHTLSVDTAIHIYGEMSSYCKIFRGTDTNEQTGRVISKTYDGNGSFVSDTALLELAAIDSHTNYAVKSVRRCHCTEELRDGEIVTLVAYADDGHVVYKRILLIENTDTISDIHASVKYISDISLDSIWLSTNSADTLEYPINIPMNALNMFGTVLYSDGSTARYPVNGGKFAMLGLDGRLSSIIGQSCDLVLRYVLDSDEVAFAATGENGRYITKPFKIVTVNPNNSITAKLFCYPEWKDSSTGYRLKWFLMNLERNIRYDVTPHVKLSSATGAFDPKLYGYLQRKAVTINLGDVSGSFIPFNHTQVVDIVLNAPPSADAEPSWEVASESTEGGALFGEGVYCRLTNKTISLKGDATTLVEWLDKYYWATRPLKNPALELKAPEPTHFVVEYAGQSREFPVTDWANGITYTNTPVVGSNVYIRFIKRTASEDLQLAYSAAIIKQY